MNHSDVVVVGGGAVGLATALNLAESHRCGVTVLEAETRVAAHQTGHNSGVIHSGLYYKPGSMKAQLCREGMLEMYRFCEEEGVPHRRTGKVVVAVHEREHARLDELARRGLANGVRVRPVDLVELAELEPNVRATAALWVDDTGVVDYARVAQAMSNRLQRLGGQVLTGMRVDGVDHDGDKFVVRAGSREVRATRLVNCAGLHSDRVARMCGVDPGVRIVPFRGEYYVLRSESAHLVRGLIYPVPDPALPFLGVHFTRGIDDVVEAGPNAVLALQREGYSWAAISARDIADWAMFPGFWRMAGAHWRVGLGEVRRSLSRPLFLKSLQTLVPGLADADIAPGPAGVRAQAIDRQGKLVDDFRIRVNGRSIHVLNAPSPAATASLAIGRRVAAQLMEIA